VDVWVTPPSDLGSDHYFFPPQKHTATIYRVFRFLYGNGTRGSYKALVTLTVVKALNLHTVQYPIGKDLKMSHS
jgi:hypothetical protein